MPLVVESISPEKFQQWVEDKQAIKLAALEEASSTKQWSRDELMARGQALYETKCAACHQATGQGLPPAFPPLNGSPVVNGPIAAHLKLVINGKPGTAMQAWGTLNDLEIAAIVTYERNAWENTTGDTIQPTDVALAR